MKITARTEFFQDDIVNSNFPALKASTLCWRRRGVKLSQSNRHNPPLQISDDRLRPSKSLASKSCTATTALDWNRDKTCPKSVFTWWIKSAVAKAGHFEYIFWTDSKQETNWGVAWKIVREKKTQFDEWLIAPRDYKDFTASFFLSGGGKKIGISKMDPYEINRDFYPTFSPTLGWRRIITISTPF